jgi:hypothetical protein
MAEELNVERQLLSALDCLEQIQQQVQIDATQNPLLLEAIASLSISLQELQITTTQLYQQNQELLATQSGLKTTPTQ